MLPLHNLKALNVPILILILMCILIGSANVAHAQTIIKIDGSSTVYPITKIVADEFQASKKSAVKVTVDISRTGGGFENFCRGALDIVNASRPILKREMAECKKSGVQYIEIPVAFDALTVAVNLENDWIDSMTVAELKNIWAPIAQGKITKWRQINPAWPDESIELFGPGLNSGTSDYFTKAVVGRVKSIRNDYTSLEDDNALVQGVANNKNALGFFGFAYYIENQERVKAVAINAGRGAVFPSVETVEDGSYQPLSRPIFIYVNSKMADKPEVREFVTFYMRNALVLVKKAKFFPLPPSAYTMMMEHFNKKRLGTVFNGISPVNLTIDELIRREARLEFEHN